MRIIFQNTNSFSESAHLTKRELEALQFLAMGKIYKEIAFEMNITINTVKKHLKNIYFKLDVQNKVEAVLKCRVSYYAETLMVP
jgi:DNA-binding CsgD family transcriptional regulator